MSRGPRLSRRSFLAGVGASGALAAAGYQVWTWARAGGDEADRRAVPAGELPPGIAGRTLVVLELAGGNDALSMVVPHADGRYHDLRPTLAIAEPIDLDGEIGLAPPLTRLASEFGAGNLAIVEGVGLEDPDLSHFESLQRWWTADAPRADAAGWLGRYLDLTVGYDDPLAGIAIGPSPSPVLAGSASFATAIADPAGLQPDAVDETVRDALLDAWARLVPSRPDAGLLGDVQRAIGETLAARDRLAEVLDTTGATGAEPMSRRARSRRRPFLLGMVEALTLAARLVAAEPPPRVVHVHAGGDFDTHQGQTGRHDALMTELDDGVDAFLGTLDELGARERVVLATTSEFGRRVRENGTGTDHGTAAAHLVLGAGVRGGRYGEAPALDRLDDAGNLVATVRLHDYYATLLGWPGVEAEPVLGARASPLPIYA